MIATQTSVENAPVNTILVLFNFGCLVEKTSRRSAKFATNKDSLTIIEKMRVKVL